MVCDRNGDGQSDSNNYIFNKTKVANNNNIGIFLG
jgi:hypothetical protein